MKSMLSNRAQQWIVTALVCCGLILAVDNRFYPAKSNPVIGVNEPVSGESIPHEIPKPLSKSVPAPLSSRIVEYHIGVTLKPDQKALEGAESLTWNNPGAKPVSELYFHLYPNAFSSKKTTFNRESGGKLREDEMTAASYGGMDIAWIKAADGEDISYRTMFVQPDDGNKDDHTLLKLSLPEPVLPGQSVTLSMGFTVKLPRVFARMGYADDFYMAGQWFPKVAVYETAGTRGRSDEGWNLHQYHGNSEFYADFGIFDVKIKVPAGYMVAATGFPIKGAAEDSGVKTYQFYADDVHDFAWAASPNFVYVEEPFSAPNVPGVRIKLYLDPKHQELKNRYLTAAKKALSRFSEWYGPYPYSTLSIIVPPANANGAGGMEYPTLVTAWGATDDKPSLELERVVVHEIGHQFFYGMVASNEFEEAWLDEGFTSYAEDKVMERDYGVKPNLPLEASYITSPAPLKWDAWAYQDHSEYGDNVYTRAKLVLSAIEREIGTDTMSRVMKTYFQRWKFKHPSTKDFQAVLEDVTKKKWDDFFQTFIYDKQMIDYTVDGIGVRKMSNDGGASAYESTVLVRRLGAVHANVPIVFHFQDGQTKEEIWNGTEQERLFTLMHTTPVDWVQVDPQHTLILENKHINNFLKAQVDPKWSIRWNLGLVKLIETMFGWVAW